VCAVFVLEAVQTVLTGADVFYWFASGYGDLDRLATPFASAIDVPIMESIVSAMVQYFYAYRVWILSNKKWWLFTLICLVGRSQAILSKSPLFCAFFLCSSPASTQWQHSPSVFMFVFMCLFTLVTFRLTIADSSTSKVRHR